MRVLFLILITCFLCSGCNTPKNTLSSDEAFTQFTKDVFCKEVASSTISLHYTLENPSSYGLENIPVSYDELATDQTKALASIENYQSALHQFQPKQLSEENQLTYAILDSYLETAALGADYMLYQEPLSPVIGIHAQLPVLLSEYQFYTSEDVETYLDLLAETDTYFQSIADFERKKAEAGLFMADEQAEEVISQCKACLNKEELRYLYTSFEEKLNALPELSDSEKQTYIAKNEQLIETDIFPSYTLLIDALNDLMGSGTNQMGLSHLPKGKSYYEYLVLQSAGISESVPELQQLTKTQILSDLAAMEEIIFPTTTSQEPSLLDSAAPSSLLNDLKTKITNTFPEIPSVETTIKYVPEDMQDNLSPAFYMIPAIDNYQKNVIYINQGQVLDGLNLYTTLAHEGYPGHLYQTVYFHAKAPDPVRSILDFGGYVEGWATYAEMMSYYLAPLSQAEATLLQKNASMLLGLYAYADMGIHYDGWSLNEMSRFFSTYGISDPVTLNTIYRLIVGTPGNYLKYYLGYLQIYNLKKEIAGELLSKFSQHDFHKAVLDVGPAPFDIVKQYVRKELLPDS